MRDPIAEVDRRLLGILRRLLPTRSLTEVPQRDTELRSLGLDSLALLELLIELEEACGVDMAALASMTSRRWTYAQVRALLAS